MVGREKLPIATSGGSGDEESPRSGGHSRVSIAANLALAKDLPTAIKDAKNYVTAALKYSLNIGALAD